ncbi:MAG: DUF2726 domain-containing protein [Candidatus Nomurabacteria bacterium]|nr:DUF2726 domain-containing protein [Candidatus Nomurabacteria bacterium]
MNPLIILVVLIIIIFLLLSKFFPNIFPQKNDHTKPLYNYKRKDFLMSRAEHEFFDILVEIVGNQYYVFPQIHLPTILDNKVVGQNWKGAFRHIDEKSVDFVVCDKAYIKPLLAIELDDKTHEREDRKDRDVEVESILKDAGIPLLRFGNNGFFNKEEIKRLVLEKLK